MYSMSLYSETETQSATTKGRTVYIVAFCSSSARKFSSLEDSCKWRWYTMIYLDRLASSKLVSKRSGISAIVCC